MPHAHPAPASRRLLASSPEGGVTGFDQRIGATSLIGQARRSSDRTERPRPEARPGESIPYVCLMEPRRRNYPPMERAMTQDSSATHRLLRRVADGDRESWGALLTRHEPRLRRMVAFRLDPRLQGRIDPGDVLQEVYLAATRY